MRKKAFFTISTQRAAGAEKITFQRAAGGKKIVCLHFGHGGDSQVCQHFQFERWPKHKFFVICSWFRTSGMGGPSQAMPARQARADLLGSAGQARPAGRGGTRYPGTRLPGTRLPGTRSWHKVAGTKGLAPGHEHISWPRTDYENDNSPMQR